MLYKYNKHFVGFVRVTWPYKLIIGIGMIAVISIILSTTISLDKRLIEKQVILVMSRQNQFSNDKLIKKIKEMNFLFPYIVYGQAILETNNFQSNVFIENKNMFGMKIPTKRVTLSNGRQGAYAYYTNWVDSLYDYGLYYATYLSQFQIEEDYYNYLSQFYAEDTAYVTKLKNIIQKQNLKTVFN